MTVADLKAKGASALNDAQLKQLIVGKAFWLSNNVTGEQFSQNFTTEGETIIFRVGSNAVMPSAFGNVERDGYQGTTSPYSIEGGKLVVPVAQEPYAFTFYKLGDTYYAARSNEFGYANYEIVAAPQAAANPLTAISNQFSLALGLTAEQQKLIVPILQKELTQLGQLKTNTTFSPLQKAEELRKISVSFDDQISPLINAEQQQKFKGVRDQMREQMIDKALGKVKAELTAAVDIH